jgi:aldehyde dehydrogenase (NAD+)
MPAQDTASTIADAAPESQVDRFKQSGIGREMGVAGLEEFLGRKTLAVPAVPILGGDT